jgi:hypothetical protein
MKYLLKGKLIRHQIDSIHKEQIIFKVDNNIPSKPFLIVPRTASSELHLM